MLAIYCRISKRKEEGTDTSITIQQRLGSEFAAKKGLLFQYYVDKGVSGQKGTEDREAFDDMLNDIESRKITSVWVVDQSRFERNEIIWFDFQATIAKYGIEYYTGNVRFDLEDEEIRVSMNIMSIINASFARRTGKKVRDSYQERITDGKAIGLTPYGYKKGSDGKLVVDEEESQVVSRIFELSLSGIGAYTIANTLNEDGIPTRYNKYKGHITKKDKYTREETQFDKKAIKWRGNVVSGIIQNRIYKGIRVLNKDKANQYSVDAPVIVQPEIYDQVIDNLQSNKKNVGKREEYKYLLNGLIYCENCGKPMRGKKREKGKDSAYKCGGGMGCRGLNIEKLETFIIRHLFYSKTLKEFLSQAPIATDEKLKTLQNKLIEKQERFAKVNRKLSRMLLIAGEDDSQDDEQFALDYSSTRKNKQTLEKEIKALELQVSEIQNNFASSHFNNVVNGFAVNQSFDAVKASIHSLLKDIRVGHFKEDKRGYFIVKLEYKRFEDVSIFTADYPLYKWNWAQYHRNHSITEEEKQDDKELYEYLNGEQAPKEFNGYETSSVMHEQVVFTKDELITFN